MRGVAGQPTEHHVLLGLIIRPVISEKLWGRDAEIRVVCTESAELVTHRFSEEILKILQGILHSFCPNNFFTCAFLLASFMHACVCTGKGNLTRHSRRLILFLRWQTTLRICVCVYLSVCVCVVNLWNKRISLSKSFETITRPLILVNVAISACLLPCSQDPCMVWKKAFTHFLFPFGNQKLIMLSPRSRRWWQQLAETK